MLPRRARARGGLTLVELVLTLALLGVVLGMVSMVGTTSGQAYRTGTALAELESSAGRALAQVVEELSIASFETLEPALLPGEATAELRYRQAIGVTAGRVELGPLRRLAFEHGEDEVDNGLDDDGDGLVDEGELVLVEDLGGPDERRRVLARGLRAYLEGEEGNGIDDDGDGLVDPRGFTVERVGGTLRVSLTLERRTAEGDALLRTARTSVRARN